MDKEAARQNELIINKEFSERRIGQFMGLRIAAVALGASIFAIAYGAEQAAMVIGDTTVVGLATVFVFLEESKKILLQLHQIKNK